MPVSAGLNESTPRPRGVVAWVLARALPCLVAAAALSGCRVEEAPDSIKDLAHWYWVHFDDLTDEELLEGVHNLDVEVTKLESAEELPLRGKVDDLHGEDMGVIVPPNGANPAAAQGMVVVTIMPCTLDEIERLFIADNQDELFPEVYDAYDREYLTSFDDYVAKELLELDWTTTYTATLLGDQYTARISGEARWVPAIEREEGPDGPVLYVRSVLREPAAFKGSASKSLSQDYQIDLYYEREPGRTVHMFADWRQMNVGTFSTDDDLFVNISLDNFIQFDERMAQLCGP